MTLSCCYVFAPDNSFSPATVTKSFSYFYKENLGLGKHNKIDGFAQYQVQSKCLEGSTLFFIILGKNGGVS